MNEIKKVITMEEAEKKVNDFLSDIRVGTNQYPLPSVDLAQAQGYNTKYFIPNSKTEAENIAGLVYYKEKLILVDPKLNATMRRFVVSHEIGHIALEHQENGETIDYYSSIFNTKDPKEINANLFASALLMPKGVFNFVWKKSHFSLQYIAKYFGVPAVVVAFRASCLGLVNLGR